MYIDIGFQDFMIEWLQDYGMIAYPVCVLAAIYGYTYWMRKKSTSAQFGFGHHIAESQSQAETTFKREAANETMHQAPNSNHAVAHERDEATMEATAGAPLQAGFDDPFEEDEDEQDSDFEQEYEYDDEDADYDDRDQDDDFDEEEVYGDYLDDAARKRQVASRAASESAPSQNSPTKEAQLVVMYLLPGEQKFFLGYELLQSLAHNHVHLSEKKHFQRFAQEDGSGQLWYHVASMAHPGTFDMSEPGKISCPGLVFILETDRVDDPSTAFNCMLETCENLAEDLGGQILDSEQRPFNENSARRIRYTIARNRVKETSTV